MAEAIITSVVSSLIVSGIMGLIVWFKTKSKESKEEKEKRIMEAELRKEGLVCLMRDRIISLCNECEEKGFASQQMIDNIDKMYQAYHKMGGNGVATASYEKLLKLPHKED